MLSLETTYGGLKLKNPIIVGSSGLTNSVDKIVNLASKGAGAVIIKSLFEEQIMYEVSKTLNGGHNYPESYEYIAEYVKSNNIKNYLNLITEAKNRVDIPIIASINCYEGKKWVEFVKEIAKAGADAIEINIYYLPVDKNRSSADYEEVYFTLLAKLKKEVNLPIIYKLGNQFTNLTAVANRLKADGVAGITLFNRFYEPDIDIERLALTSSEVFSTPSELRRVLRWIAIIHDKVKGLEMSASTGIHDSKGAIKCLLAGASSVQLCSTIYKNGVDVIPQILQGIEQWMERKNFHSIKDFKGLMSYQQIPDPAAYERSQFMKHFSNLE